MTTFSSAVGTIFVEALPRHIVIGSYQCWGSVTLWCGSGPMDPDPTPFFSYFKDVKKIVFHIFFLKLTRTLKVKFCDNTFILQALFQSAQHFYEKREGSESVPLTNGSGSGSSNNTRIRFPTYFNCFPLNSSRLNEIGPAFVFKWL